ncbi:uncharacterized protein PHA67_002720 isoform 2-T2 [Liasis olivaceus]
MKQAVLSYRVICSRPNSRANRAIVHPTKKKRKEKKCLPFFATWLLTLSFDSEKSWTSHPEELNGDVLRGEKTAKNRSWEGCFERGTETISMDTWTREEEEPPFKGLPPLPKVFWGAHPSQELLPGVAEQEETKPLEGNCTSLHGKISWVQNEVLSLRRSDLALFHRLYLLALEIQDLSELHQEMETFSKEQLAAEDPNRAGDRKATAPNPPFELSI